MKIKAMNTSVCFVFLLAIGLSMQESEFEIDFDRMVNSKKLPNGRTLLNCPENCEVAKEQCQCVDFSSCMEHSVCDCIEKFNFATTYKRNVCRRLKKLPDLRKETDWQTPKSPKVFLDTILTTYQKSMAQQNSG